MKPVKKLLAGIVAVFVVLSCVSCGTIGIHTQLFNEHEKASGVSDESTNDDGRNAAYKKVVQQVVNKYGVFDSQKASSSYNLDSGTTRGFFNAKTVDITKDGKDELFVIYADNHIHMSVYEYENGSAQKKWSDVAFWGGVFNFSLCTNDEITTWVTYESSATPRKMYTYKDGRYLMADGHEIDGYFSIGPNPNSEGIMLEALASELDIEDEYNAGNFREIMSWGGSGTLMAADTEQLVSDWGIKVTEPKVSALDVLGNIKYYGDKSKCKMTREMALAYADAIESKQSVVEGNSGEQFGLYAALLDLSGDGMPILLTVIASTNSEFVFPMNGGYSIFLWTWNGQEAEQYDLYKDLSVDNIDDITFTEYAGDGRMYIGEGGGGLISESTHGWLEYKVSNAQISLVNHETIYAASIDTANPDFAICENFPGADSERFEGNYRVAKISDLLDAGWLMGEVSPQSGGRYLYIRVVNGNIVKFNSIESYNKVAYEGYPESGTPVCFFRNNAGELYLKSDMMTLSHSATENLRIYAEVAGKPVYSYDDVYEMFDKSVIEQIAKKAAKKYDGEVGEIFRLSDDLYYVIIYTDNKVSGTMIVKNTKNGKDWKVVKSSEEPLPEEALSKEVNKDSQTSNIEIDFGKVEDGIKHIEEVIKNIDGTVLNPSAKEELVKFIDASISRCTLGTVKAKKNIIAISGKDVKKVSAKADNLKKEYKELLDKNNITLDKPITVIIQFVAKGADLKKPVQIKVTDDILKSIGGANGINIVLGDSLHTVKITKESYEKIISEHGEITVVLQNNGDGVYEIQFADANGDIIKKLCASVTFTVPANNELCTIQAEYTGGADNWGAQYDSINSALVFDIIYSGTYTVIDKKIDISDIEGLSEEEQKAIKFMVSKGFFELSDKEFNPDGSLTRYAFAKALVKMCFAVDNDDKTNLIDMTKDDPYYPYVASGETKGIIEGYDDKMFHGNDEALREEVIALCSRTLEKRKGYIRPEVPQDYLHFNDNDDILWGHGEISLAVRAALIDDGGSLNPRTPTSRKDAALILYRLFMLLHEVEPVAITTSSASDGFGGILWPALAGVAIAAVIGGVIVVVVLKKKKTSAKALGAKKENSPDNFQHYNNKQ